MNRYLRKEQQLQYALSRYHVVYRSQYIDLCLVPPCVLLFTQGLASDVLTLLCEVGGGTLRRAPHSYVPLTALHLVPHGLGRIACVSANTYNLTVSSHLKRHAEANTGHEQIYTFLKAIFSISIGLDCGNYGKK